MQEGPLSSEAQAEAWQSAVLCGLQTQLGTRCKGGLESSHGFWGISSGL